MINILSLLETGDKRTIGDSNKVVMMVLKKPELIDELFEGLHSTNPALRMRASDALEKVSNKNRNLIQKYKEEIINLAIVEKQQEVEWHLAQILSYLKLDAKQKNEVKDILENYLENSKSNIVKVMSLQSLFDIFKDDKIYVDKLINKALDDNSPLSEFEPKSCKKALKTRSRHKKKVTFAPLQFSHPS